jgi:ketosteroid isomerase-like protein
MIARAQSLVAAVAVAAVALGAGLSSAAPPPGGDAQAQVRARERAFAKTMADRDHAAFVSFLADETVFLGETPLRGKTAVAAAWKKFYDGPKAPFAWEPDIAEVLESGSLALTSGPVFDPEGKRVGTFNSIWRREADGQWRIVFDKGCPPCNCR